MGRSLPAPPAVPGPPKGQSSMPPYPIFLLIPTILEKNTWRKKGTLEQEALKPKFHTLHCIPAPVENFSQWSFSGIVSSA